MNTLQRLCCLCRSARPACAAFVFAMITLVTGSAAHAQLGACCLCFGQCIDNATQTQCIAQNGIYYPNQSCQQINCREWGACCFQGVSCVDQMFFDDCALQGGSFAPCQTCLDIGCGEGEQACCFCDGVCVDLPANICSAQGGTPTAGLCANVTCPKTGACCLQPGAIPNCVDNISDANCAAIGGVSFHLCLTCAEIDCDGFNPGACCFCDGHCQDLFTFDCIALGGSPAAGTCATVHCPKVGACCIDPVGGTTCIDNVTEGDCYNVYGGYFFWECMDCTQIICDPFEEACCFCDGVCADLTPADCTAQGGMPQGPGTACATFTCRRSGACCFDGPNGPFCVDNVSEPACIQGGGVFYVCQTCDEIQCGPEACCFCEGSCLVLFVPDCLNAGGVPQGPGTNCATIECELYGACCYNNGPAGPYCIDNVPQSSCSLATSVFYPCQDCTEVPCGEEACCFCDGTCVVLPAPDCIAQGGTPQGGGTNCANVQCLPYGACCFLDTGICVDNTSIVNCPTFNAVFYPCQDCADIECGLEACCFCDGTCQDLTPTDCLNVGGNPQGPGSSCATTNCPRTGACCIDGICIDNLTATACLQQGGQFFLCQNCNQIPCDPVGACCFTCEPPPPSPPCPDPRPAGPPCVDNLTKEQCELIWHGIYRGDGTVCQIPGGPPLCRCIGDINGDGSTNAADFTILAGMFGGGIPNCKLHSEGDLNCDGVVNAADFVILAADFGCVGP